MQDYTDSIKRIPKKDIQEAAKALAGDLRLRIVEVLGEGPMSISQLAEALGVAQPTVTINVQLLEAAGLVASRQGANREKICYRDYDTVVFDLPMKPGEGLQDAEDIHMPIGLFTGCQIEAPCGIFGSDEIGCPDDPRAFYQPERGEAALLWFSGTGYVEYQFPNPLPPGVLLRELRFSAELCSEAPGFDMNWPSDIGLWINGRLTGEWSSPGDYGDRKGVLTPYRWTGGTQYGMLAEWKITAEGSFVNGKQASSVTLGELDLHFSRPVVVRLGVREDAKHPGGMNLFGAGFGDHPQGLKMTFVRQS